MSRAPLPLLLFAVVGCGVEVDETLIAQADGVRLIERHRHGLKPACAGGHGFGFCVPERVDSRGYWFEFDDRELHGGCLTFPDDVELLWDEDHERLAVFCAGQWRIAYIAGEAYAGWADAPAAFDGTNWSVVPDFVDTAETLFGRFGSRTLLDAFAEETDVDTAADFIVERCADRPEVGWENDLPRLSGKLMNAIRVRLREAVVAGRDGDAFESCVAAIPKPEVLPESQIESAEARLATPDLQPWEERWLLWELRRTTAGSRAACAWVSRQDGGSWTSVDGPTTTTALLAILDDASPCPALADFVDPPCHPEFVNTDRDGVPEPFSEEEHRMVLETIQASSAGYPSRDAPVVYTVVLEALRERVDASSTRTRLARLHYDTSALPEGCPRRAALVAACEQPVDAQEATTGTCSVLIDDEARTLTAAPDPARRPPAPGQPSPPAAAE